MDLFLPVKPAILVADSSEAGASMLKALLQTHYSVETVQRGREVLALAQALQPELILLDSQMADMAGFAVCNQLKADPLTHAIPVIFLANHADSDDEDRAMTLGAVDYVSRSVNPKILLTRIRAHLVNAAQAKTLHIDKTYLEFEVEKRAQAFAQLQQTTILALAALAEVRDQDTGNHLLRTQNYIRALANHLSRHDRFSDYLKPHVIDMVFKCAPLHDIGKVGIPDRILLKKGRYEPHEFEFMKSHPRLGYEALMNAQGDSGEDLEFLEIAKQIVYCHHEKWDGSGYPQGLVGDAIPIPARLMALADVYDALISKRVYKDGMSHERAKALIVEGRGRHFDPDVVDAFLRLEDEFQDIARRYSDSDEELATKAAFLSQVMG
jgi:putative two-component system response regulator